MSDHANELEPGESPARQPVRAALTQREWNLPWKQTFLDTLALIPNASEAARRAGRSRGRVYAERDEDPEFRLAWEEAVNVGIDALEGLGHQRATVGYPKRVVKTRTRRERGQDGAMRVVEEETIVEETTEISNGLLIFLLKAHRPEKYRERYEHRVSGDPAAPLELEIYRRPSRERMLGLVQLAQELEVVEGEFTVVEDERGQQE